MEKKYVKGKDYKETFFRVKDYGKRGKLIINELGKWVLLTNEEYKKLVFRDFNESLFKKLEESLIIKTKENSKEILKFSTAMFWDITNATSLHILVPTLRCNHTCSYCYAFRKPEEAKGFDMSKETAKRTVDFIFQAPAPSIVIEFTGGEPLLKPDIVKYVVEYAEEKNKKTQKTLGFALVTNGTLLDEEMFRFIKEHKIGLCFSLDGPKAVHDEHRKYTKNPKKSTYEDVYKLLKKYKVKEYKERTFALPVITKASLPNYKEIIDLYVSLGIKSFRYKYLTDFGFATSNWKSLSYSPEQFVKTWKDVVEYILELNKKGIAVREEITSIFIRKLILGQNPGFAELAVPCGAVDGQIIYDYDGGIYTCDEARTLGDTFKIGNVHDMEYKDMKNNKIRKLMKVNSALFGFTCDDCPWLPFCGICPLENYKKEGTMIVNIPTNSRCFIHKSMIEYIFEKVLFDKEKSELLKKWPKIN
ncbi:MAG TPA: His-Xaa-Ser system radical SAM maturase HxsB [Candidatus Woesearchaeota archaeon]|nr:His-Xaa-Ser system radical SAM maturase HxsB [Candidatus Woesearchaeota archaeon]